MKRAGLALLVIALLAGCVPVRSSTTQTPQVSEALRRDAEAMAGDLGITVDDAVRRLQLQDDIGDLRAALASAEAETFAGLWIQHDPEYRIVVAFTRGGKRTVRPYLGGKTWADLVEVRDADATLSELEAALDETVRATAALDFPVMVGLNEVENQVEISVSARAWFEGELLQAGIELPDRVALVLVPGPSPLEIDICAASPVEGVAFPRQDAVPRAMMAAEMIGTLTLSGGCLRVESLFGDGSYLPVWPAEFDLKRDGNTIAVVDGAGEVVARTGEEVYMGGGEGSFDSIPECARQQLSPACGEPVWVVGEGVRPNLRADSDLFSLQVISSTERSFLMLRKQPVLDEWADRGSTATGTLVLWEGQRCLRIWSETGLGDFLPLWPQSYGARFSDGQVEILDGAGEVVARTGDEVSIPGGLIPGGWQSERYRELYYELPGDCYGPWWIVGE